MIAPLSLALSTASLPVQTAGTKVGHAFVAGERTTYDVTGELPMKSNSEGAETSAKGRMKGTLTMRVLSVAADGSAEVEFAEREMTIDAMGATIPMPATEPTRVKLDRQGYQLSEPKSGSFSAVFILMFGVPGEVLTIDRPFEWKPLGALPGGALAAKAGDAPTIKLRDLKNGKATLERSMALANGETLTIVTTHDLATQRVLKGEFVMKGGEQGEFKVGLALKNVVKEPVRAGGPDGR